MERYQREEEQGPSSRVPVFVFPSSISFNAKDRDNLKQILTIYNPYEFPIRFKVLSNAPANTYTVVDPEGSIKSKNCADLILRVSEIPQESGSVTHVEHKFRVQIYHYGDKQLIGKRDVMSVIHWGKLPASYSNEAGSLGSAEGFKQCPSGGSSSVPSGRQQEGHGQLGPSSFLHQGQQPNYVVIVTALFCIVSLMLPISRESCVRDSSSSSQTMASFVPEYLHLTVNQKLLAAYALGLVTMVIFRP